MLLLRRTLVLILIISANNYRPDYITEAIESMKLLIITRRPIRKKLETINNNTIEIMLSIEELISTYEKYTDVELLQVHSKIENYSDEAKKALNIVITNKGGMDSLMKRLQERKIIDDEIQRISKEVTIKGRNTEIYYLKQVIASNILSKEKVNEIIDTTFSKLKSEEEDRKIKPSTIGGSILGGFIASIVGGILWSLEMIYTGRIFFILIFGLALLCYGIIRLFTRQSNKNIAVSIATIISTLIALFLGQILYDFIGYKG